VGGGKYVFSAYVKTTEVSTKPAIKAEFHGAGAYLGDASYEFTGLKVGSWQQVQYEFTAPEGIKKIGLMLRCFSGGTTYWDNASLVGPKTEGATVSLQSVEGVKLPPKELLPMAADGKEMIVNNPSFEEGTEGENGLPKGWSGIYAQKDDFGEPYVYVTDEKAHTGKYSVKVSSPIANLPWVMYMMPVTEGDIMQASMWVKQEQSAACGFKFEFYSENKVSNETSVKMDRADYSEYFGILNAEWYQYSDTVQVPKNAKWMALYLRAFTANTVYFDDVSCYKVSSAPQAELDTDNVLYYADQEYGTATLDADGVYYPEIRANGSASFRLLKDGNVLFEKGKTPLKEGMATFSYSLSYLNEEKVPYVVEATIYDAFGTAVNTFTQRIYKYPRPATLGKDGVITKNGVRIENPVYSYGAWDTKNTFPELSKAGIQVVQGSPNDAYLEAAKQNNIYVLGVLYGKDETSWLTPAGHPQRAERTKEIVKKYKDHPNLIGWMVMDEYSLFYPTSYDLMEESYKIIRSIDDTNPVYTMECERVAKTPKYVDLVGYDPYPGGAQPVATNVADFTEAFTACTAYQKPLWALNQTFAYGSNKNYVPEGTEVKTYYPTAADSRSMIYQALFSGADGVGHYLFEGTKSGQNLNSKGDPEIEAVWNELCRMNEGELSEAFNHFAYRKYPIFREGKSGNTRYSLYVKDGVLKAVILNQNPTMLGGDEVFEIPLESDCGTAKIGKFTATCIAGSAENISGTGTLSGVVPKNNVVVYTIVPEGTVDYSQLKVCEYRDLSDHPWAAAQIRRLASRDIITGRTEWFYRPGEAITRGDFAKFLIRALGLKAETTDNFADVDSSQSFAKEIAIGKKLGILKGTDGVNYNPYEEISRQDLMVICARGMRIVKQLEDGDASGFTDAEAIADYAVADVAAMVRANIVNGYEDGTVRPRGNTTRAEAAVIMDRIVNWNEGL